MTAVIEHFNNISNENIDQYISYRKTIGDYILYDLTITINHIKYVMVIATRDKSDSFYVNVEKLYIHKPSNKLYWPFDDVKCFDLSIVQRDIRIKEILSHVEKIVDNYLKTNKLNEYRNRVCNELKKLTDEGII